MSTPRDPGDQRSAGSVAGSLLATVAGAATQTLASVFSGGAKPPLRAVDPARRAPDPRRRVLAVLIVFVVLFGAVIVKATGLQVLDRGRYLSAGESQRTSTQVLAADRGSILDRNGAELAVSRPARSVFVDPKLVTDAPVEAAALAPVLGLDVDWVQARMTGKGRFAYLARKVDPDLADRVAALHLAGVAFLEESERYFPSGDNARAVVGSTDVDNVGTSGLELQFDDVLTGTPGRLSLESSPKGHTIAVGDHSLTPAVKGDDVKLTIDRALQYEATRLLSDQVRTSKAKGGTAIVTRPGTGEILAMTTVVTDPETGAVTASSNNAALTTQYEPGSVMKMITVAGALEAGTVAPDTMFDLPPTLTFFGDTFGEAEGRGSVSWDTTHILTESSNIGTIKIAQTIGKERLYGMQKLFGFGSRTALNFPNETAGSVLDPSKYSGTSLPSIAIGQGIAVSPLQMLFAYNTIANKGTYIPPKLVDATIDANGDEHPTPVGSSRQVVSPATADTLNVMLRNVVQNGTGQMAAINGYTVAGKTGTARKAQVGGGYTDSNGITHYQSTFVGFMPAEQPALSIYVMIDEPWATGYVAAATAAPVFSKLGTFALSRLGISPAATDAARGGAPANGGNSPANPTAAVVTSGDRVRAVTAGSAEAAAAAAPTTVPQTTTTTVKRATTTAR